MNNIFLGYPPENIKQWIKSHSGPDLSIPLCFTAVDAGATIALKCNGNNLKTATFQTSIDGNTWTDYTYATSITLANAGDKVYFKAKADNTSIARDNRNYLQFTTTQTAKKVKVSDNVMSLLSPEFKDLKDLSTIKDGQPGTYEFYKLFYDCKNIYDSSELMLPATTIASFCYNSMFQGCTSLISAPQILPATTLAGSCYTSMFTGCASLVQAPELPATTLASGCYTSMFQGCTSLISAPQILPATTLAGGCYNSMFQGCTSLVQAPELPATTLADSCCNYMFQGCTSLVQAPELPATTLASGCYNFMFQGCTSLTQAPVIKTYESDFYAFDSMLAEFDNDEGEWGQLIACNWPDLTLSDVESMVIIEAIFGYDDPGEDVRINITFKDGSGVAYFDPVSWLWVFEY